MCYDRLAKRFGAYDSDTLQPFLTRRLTAWYKQFPATGAVAEASDSDEGGGTSGKAPRPRVQHRPGALKQKTSRHQPLAMSEAPALVQPC